MTVDVVNEGGREGHLHTHFDDLNQLAGAVADELIQSLTAPSANPVDLDPVLRIAFGCDAFIERRWKILCGRRSPQDGKVLPAVGQVARNPLKIYASCEQSPQAELSLGLHSSVGWHRQSGHGSVGDGRLKDPDRPRSSMHSDRDRHREARRRVHLHDSLAWRRAQLGVPCDKAPTKPTAPLRRRCGGGPDQTASAIIKRV